jgi:hypothetical protein
MDIRKAPSIGWCDVELEGIEWRESGRDLVLRLREPPSNATPGRHRTLVCRWAGGLNISLCSPDGHGGTPFTWDGTVAQLSDGRFSVDLDFASHGHLRLVCSEVDIQIEE